MTRGRTRRRWMAPLLVLAALVLSAAPAWAATVDSSSVAGVRAALENDPVYVAPDAEGASLVDAGALRRAIGNAPIVVAVLPTQARQAAPGGSVDALPEAIGGQRAVVVLCGRSLRAGASTSVLPSGRAGELARRAQRDHAGSFDRANVQGALTDLVAALRREVPARSTGGSGGSGGSGDDEAPVWPWVLGGLVVVGGGGAAYVAARRRRRARAAAQQLDAERAEVESLYSRLGADVSSLDPGSDAVARQALADASERYTATGALLSRAATSGELAAAGHAAAEGLHAARVARQRLGLDVGPPIPEPLRPSSPDQPALDRPREVQVGDASYQGYPTYAPGAPYYFPGGVVGGGYVPGGWYGSRFWEGALLGGLAGTVLLGGMGGLGGFGWAGMGWGGMGWGGWGPGYGMGYGSGYESGYDAGLEQGGGTNGGDWAGAGNDGWSGDGDWSGGGGDWSGGDDIGGGDFGGDFGGGDFGGGDSGGGDW